MPTSADRPLVALVLYYDSGYEPLRLTMARHIKFLDASPRRHRVIYWNCGAPAPKWLRRVRLDLIVLHYSALSARWQDNVNRLRLGIDWVADSPATKIAMPQDEYDLAAVLDDWLVDLSVDVVMSVLEPGAWPLLYPRTSARVRMERTLTGFVDEEAIRPFAALVHHAARPLDIVYRARALPFRYGTLAQRKHQIAEIVRPKADALGLHTDISTEHAATKYGNDWMNFLESGRCVIGTESGTSSLDLRGEMRHAESELRARRPDLTFEEFSAAMPKGWDEHRFTAISPRAFEAAITGCSQLLVEGEYSGVLEPDIHYLPIRSDYSNLEDVLGVAADPHRTESLARRAYHDLVASGRYTHRRLAEHVERLAAEAGAGSATAMGGRMIARAIAPVARTYGFSLAEAPGWAYRLINQRAPFLGPPARMGFRIARHVRQGGQAIVKRYDQARRRAS